MTRLPVIFLLLFFWLPRLVGKDLDRCQRGADSPPDVTFNPIDDQFGGQAPCAGSLFLNQTLQEFL